MKKPSSRLLANELDEALGGQEMDSTGPEEAIFPSPPCCAIWEPGMTWKLHLLRLHPAEEPHIRNRLNMYRPSKGGGQESVVNDEEVFHDVEELASPVPPYLWLRSVHISRRGQPGLFTIVGLSLSAPSLLSGNHESVYHVIRWAEKFTGAGHGLERRETGGFVTRSDKEDIAFTKMPLKAILTHLNAGKIRHQIQMEKREEQLRVNAVLNQVRTSQDNPGQRNSPSAAEAENMGSVVSTQSQSKPRSDNLVTKKAIKYGLGTEQDLRDEIIGGGADDPTTQTSNPFVRAHYSMKDVSDSVNLAKIAFY